MVFSTFCVLVGRLAVAMGDAPESEGLRRGPAACLWIPILSVLVALILWWWFSRGSESGEAEEVETSAPLPEAKGTKAPAPPVVASESAPAIEPVEEMPAVEPQSEVRDVRLEAEAPSIDADVPAPDTGGGVEAPSSDADAPTPDTDVGVEVPSTDAAVSVPDSSLDVAGPSIDAEESAPDIDLDTESPTIESEVPSQPDDLKRIEGIGPKISGLLGDAGISAFSQLASMEASRIKEILSERGLRSPADPTTWPEQAALATEGKWDELETLQAGLKGGRRV